MFKDIECTLSIIKSSNLPIIGIKLKYQGKTPLDIDWDKDFGYVLWSGDFILVNEASKIDKTNVSILDVKISINKKNTASLYRKTSNTYEAREFVELNAGDALSSTLDFSKLPISIEEDLIYKKNSVLRLYYRYEDKNGTEILEPISNQLRLKLHP